LGGLILEHDELASMPDWVIFDLLCADVLYYKDYDRLPEKHEFCSWLGKSDRHDILKFIDRTSFGQKVPIGTTQIGIFVRYGDGYALICGIVHVDDERKQPDSAKKSHSGG
jgi:hypothetical protein